jgi:methyltransferase (TIGR00027 family)
MARTHDDSWDLASSVGATATMIAAGRAMATKDPRGLINDPFAEQLVRAVGLDFFVKMIDGEVDFSTIENASPARVQAIIDGVAVRTKYFDEYLMSAMDAGVRQVVILASGLDSRAYRLRWPADTVVYEIDQPQVIDFKTATLADIGARPTATRRTIRIDLRSDWPSALLAAGLDATAPTSWLAEGLLIYLPPEAQDRLFDNITALSVLGSTIATEYVPGIKDFNADRARELAPPLREQGVDIDMPSLVYAGERSHVIDYLRTKGWDVACVPREELFIRNELDVPAPRTTTRSARSFLSAARSGAKTGTRPATARWHR